MEKYRVKLIDTTNMKTSFTEWIDGEYSEFMWEDGNYSCDCNRGLFFYNHEKEIPCGDGRFKIIEIEKVKK